MSSLFFITGTDTGSGKTVLTALLARYLCERRVRVAALKPVCSGGRMDAQILKSALGGSLTLDEINPWHFRAPVAPVLAARQERKSLAQAEVLAFIRGAAQKYDVTLVEGAGGLLSPLGENFDSRTLIMALKADPIVVACNRLGVVNHVLLTLEALPKAIRAKVKIVLMEPPKPDASTLSNAGLLASFLTSGRILHLPWLGRKPDPTRALKDPRVRRTLAVLLKA